MSVFVSGVDAAANILTTFTTFVEAMGIVYNEVRYFIYSTSSDADNEELNRYAEYIKCLRSMYPEEKISYCFGKDDKSKYIGKFVKDEHFLSSVDVADKYVLVYRPYQFSGKRSDFIQTKENLRLFVNFSYDYVHDGNLNVYICYPTSNRTPVTNNILPSLLPPSKTLYALDESSLNICAPPNRCMYTAVIEREEVVENHG